MIHCCHQGPFTPLEKDQLPTSIVLNDMHLQAKMEGYGKRREKNEKEGRSQLHFSGEQWCQRSGGEAKETENKGRINRSQLISLFLMLPASVVQTRGLQINVKWRLGLSKIHIWFPACARFLYYEYSQLPIRRRFKNKKVSLVMILTESRAVLVCWFVSRIEQKQPNGFTRNLERGWVSAQNRPC